jgi:hypothetical protein
MFSLATLISTKPAPHCGRPCVQGRKGTEDARYLLDTEVAS